MIVSETTKVKICPSNVRHWTELGYECKYGNELIVQITKLKPNSQMIVLSKCDDCGHEWKQSYQKAMIALNGNGHRCYQCARNYVGRLSRVSDELKIRNPKKKDYVQFTCKECSKHFRQELKRLRSTDTCGRCSQRLKLTGREYPPGYFKRIKPSTVKSELLIYSQRVRYLSEKTYRANIELLNPNNHVRAKSGKPNAYQLDHIISIKKAFTMGMSVEEASAVTNLQVIPWKQNRDKWDR